MTWPTTWRSRWMTRTPSQCQSRASHQQNVGRTCTSCSTSTPSSPIPLASWRKAPRRTAFQVEKSFQHTSNSTFQLFSLTVSFSLCFTLCFIFRGCYCLIICTLCSANLTDFLHDHCFINTFSFISPVCDTPISVYPTRIFYCCNRGGYEVVTIPSEWEDKLSQFNKKKEKKKWCICHHRFYK